MIRLLLIVASQVFAWTMAVGVGWIACQRHHLRLMKREAGETADDVHYRWWMACGSSWPTDWSLVLPLPKFLLPRVKR